MDVVRSGVLPPLGVFQAKPDLMYVGPKVYRMLQWETDGKRLWAGRDRRRIKRERRKFLAAAPH